MAVEYQGDSTPHGHMFVVLSNMFARSSLSEIAQLLEAGSARLSAEDVLERILAFNGHLTNEEHINHEQHEANLHELEREFHANNDGPKANVYLSTRSQYFYSYGEAPIWWKETVSLKSCVQEATKYKKRYEADTQFVLSHVQHH
jgi:hypothetical protein